MKLFSGTAHQSLSQTVAQSIGVNLGKCEVIRFDNSEVRVRILEDVKDQVCTIIQPTSNPTDTHIIELFFFADALKRGGAKEIIGIIPYFGYARQNIQHRSGEAVSANVVIRLLESIGFNKIISLDIHDEGAEGIFSIPFTHLSALSTLAQRIKKDFSDNPVSIISPDQGGVERARLFANSYFDNESEDIVVVEKKRNQDVAHQSEALELYGEVDGKTAIIVDDIITSGGTLLNAARLCLDRGAKEVVAAIVHHDFSPHAPYKIQQSPIKTFYTTDSIHLPKNHSFDKLVEVSIADLIKKELSNL